MEKVILLFIALTVQQVFANSDCQKLCTQQYQPVCGTDHKTYHNLCYLQMVECEAMTHDRVIGLAGHGPCNGVPLTYGCNTNTTCDVMTLQSVCGSDGVTYRNPCLLHQAACKLALTGKKMIKKHDGECSEIESDPNCPAFCENDLDPVCSKGNVTYRNACILKQLYCKFAHTGPADSVIPYEVKHNGTCDHKETQKPKEIDCTVYGIHASSTGHVTCPRVDFSNTEAIVCGIDFHSYFSDCYYCLSMLRKHKLPDTDKVMLFDFGACPAYLSTHTLG